MPLVNELIDSIEDHEDAVHFTYKSDSCLKGVVIVEIAATVVLLGAQIISEYERIGTAGQDAKVQRERERERERESYGKTL